MFYDKNIDSKQIASLKCWIYLREFYASPIIEVYNMQQECGGWLESGLRVRDSVAIETPNVARRMLALLVNIKFSSNSETWMQSHISRVAGRRLPRKILWDFIGLSNFIMRWARVASVKHTAQWKQKQNAFHAGWHDQNGISIGRFVVLCNWGHRIESLEWEFILMNCVICTQNRLLACSWTI